MSSIQFVHAPESPLFTKSSMFLFTFRNSIEMLHFGILFILNITLLSHTHNITQTPKKRVDVSRSLFHLHVQKGIPFTNFKFISISCAFSIGFMCTYCIQPIIFPSPYLSKKETVTWPHINKLTKPFSSVYKKFGWRVRTGISNRHVRIVCMHGDI